MNGNLPLGAENDPRAPYNQVERDLPLDLLQDARDYLKDALEGGLIWEALEEAGFLEEDMDAAYDQISNDIADILS